MVNAIVLCSGGIDSVTTAYYVKKKLNYEKIIFLFFDYGQKTVQEEKRASIISAKKLGAKFIEIKLGWLGKISNSLINKEGEIKKLKREELKDTAEESKNWYVPCRNTVFLTSALGLAEAFFIKNKEIYDLFVGFKNEGKEGYPDTTPEFVKEMNKLSKVSCARAFKIKAPLIKKDKEEIIKLGTKLGVDYKDSFSCYVGKKIHCGSCLACKLRQEGFYWAGLKDPTSYQIKDN